MLYHKTNTLSSFVVNILGINPPSLTILGKKLFDKCEAAWSAVQLQCGREYGFSDTSDVKATVISALDFKHLEELPTTWFQRQISQSWIA